MTQAEAAGRTSHRQTSTAQRVQEERRRARIGLKRLVDAISPEGMVFAINTPYSASLLLPVPLVLRQGQLSEIRNQLPHNKEA